MTDGAPPKQIGQFEVLKRLGYGGMAEVFLAKKRGAEGTFKVLVLKRILQAHGQSRRFRQMFVAEAQLATRLNHPNIVQVYDFQDIGDEGQLLSMEYVEGVDLGKLVSSARARGQRLPPWVSAYIIAEAGKGLHYAHERKDEAGQPLAIVHRDVSPQNILISYDGTVKIADFGIASANLFREEPGVLKGKFAYMSPEQARGESLDRRSDIFALGVCLHEMLTGRPLYGSLSGDDLLAQVRDSRPLPPGVTREDLPKELDDIVMKALERDREGRYQTAREMSAAISRAILAKQELVDGASVEAVVNQLVGREHTSPGVDAEGQPARSSADQPLSDGSATIAAAPRARQGTGVAREKTGQQRRLSGRANREVRHVALVTLKLWGFDELEMLLGKAKALSALEPIRRILDEIAYKRGASWTWDDDLGRAQAVVGLLANSSRAAADAARPRSTCTKHWQVQARISLFRCKHRSVSYECVASGERDKDGRLAHHELQAPVELLAGLLRDRAPVGSTWVAGGLYRRCGEIFGWGDARPSMSRNKKGCRFHA
ncbi:MAG: serine/threonine-protein kinase [Polyangiaceae bacterium]